jgi:hypothetical protein
LVKRDEAHTLTALLLGLRSRVPRECFGMSELP